MASPMIKKIKTSREWEFLSILSFLIQLEFVRQVRIFLIVNERKDIPISRRENEREEDPIYLQNTMILKIDILIYQDLRYQPPTIIRKSTFKTILAQRLHWMHFFK